MKNLIAKNVPQTLFKTYYKCEDCHLYGVIDSMFAITNLGNEQLNTYGCTTTRFIIDNLNEVHRNCPYLFIEDNSLESELDLMEVLEK